MEDQCRSCADEINGGGFDILFGNACQYLRTTPIAGLINIPSAICLHEPFRWFYEAMPELPWIVPAQSFERSPLLSFREFRRRLSRWSALNSIDTSPSRTEHASDLIDLATRSQSRNHSPDLQPRFKRSAISAKTPNT